MHWRWVTAPEIIDPIIPELMLKAGEEHRVQRSGTTLPNYQCSHSQCWACPPHSSMLVHSLEELVPQDFTQGGRDLNAGMLISDLR